MKHARSEFDVIVVGGGHAGTEAALAAVRAGAKTALVTQRISTIGQMSCNPAIGGIGKTHLVREVDALDGLMARAADAAAIHYRLLNSSKGPAVHGARVQCDRQLYLTFVQSEIRSAAIVLIEDEVSDVLVAKNRVCGARLECSGDVAARAVVVTTGTFLNGVIHVGRGSASGGRAAERASLRLADRLRDLGAPIGRLKTGTPPRLDGRTIDWDRIDVQNSDVSPTLMSFLSSEPRKRLIACGVTETNERTHEIVRVGMRSSPLSSGAITGVGPRYCPSIEDKVRRFPDRPGHRIFLEPEGLDNHIVYPNGVSTSLARETQVEMIRSIAGLERAEITASGYAIEYDFVDPRSLGPDLGFNGVPGLYLAGQINGTTGYEEAAAQGLVAGLNAATSAKGGEPVIFDREDGYTGVLIDDLVTKGVSEPYRMFTSRVEHRLFLRPDNADQRLTPTGRAASCVRDERWRLFLEKSARLDLLRRHLQSTTVTPAKAKSLGLDIRMDGVKRTTWDMLSLHRIEMEELSSIWGELADLEPTIAETLSAEALYEPYVHGLAAKIGGLSDDLALPIPSSMVFEGGSGLSAELLEKLNSRRPASLAEAARIEGMTPAALDIIRFRVRKAMVSAA